MKKNVIALLLAAVMVLGSIGGVPVMAAETTAQESVTIEEDTEEVSAETAETNEAASEGGSAEAVEEDPEQGSTGSAEESETVITEETGITEDSEEVDSADIADTSAAIAVEEEANIVTTITSSEMDIQKESKEAVIAFAGGNGTAEDPYKIETAEQLDAVRNDLNACYVLISDIDLSGKNWEPIADEWNGTKVLPFRGEFDGNNHVIANMTIHAPNTSKLYGLFGLNAGKLRNIDLKDCDISLDLSNASGDSNYILSIGSIAGVSEGIITNCRVSGSIKLVNALTANVGGIVGYGEATYSTNSIDITINSAEEYWNNSSYTGQIYCGGIVGESSAVNGIITNCINYGSINTESDYYLHLGGISGEYGAIKKCVNYGSIVGRSISKNKGWSSFAAVCNVGGIIGSTSSNTLNDCVNFGDISGKGESSCYVGGIAGWIGYYGNGTIKNCYNVCNDISSSGKAARVAATFVYASELYSIDTTLVNGAIPTEEIGTSLINGENMSLEDIKISISDILDECGCEWLVPPGEGTEIDSNTIVYYKDGRHLVTPGYNLDDCLTNNSTEYNPRLAYMLIALATSAYQGKEPFTPLHPTEGEDGGGFPDKPLAITESLKNLGFSADNIIEEQYYTNAYDPSYGEDSTAYTIATKPLSTGEEIVTIVVRGSYGEFDLFDYSKWANDWKGNTNFKNYDRGLHEGFSIAADKIYERLESFLSEKSINKNNVKFVITGHSRGAAVANLVSKKLIDKGIPTNKVYDYNFACPDSGRDYDGEWNRDNKYGGMFNINNVKDIIGVIPGALFLSTLNTTSFFTGFFDRLLSFNFNYDVLFWGKYGTTYFFSNEWTALTDTVFGDPNVEHHPTTYLNYLSDKPSNSSFKSWLEARAIFTSNVTGITELGKVLGIFCPVNTEIYDSNGSIIAKVTDGEQYYYNDSFGQVVIITAGDQCLIYIKGKDDYSIKMEGTDEGTLDFFVADAISPENEEQIITFENISLEQGKVINSIIHAEESVEKTALYIIDENGNPIKEILHDGTEELINTIGKMNISGISSKVYTGKALKQELTITHNDVMLQENTDYTVKYENNINVGIAKVIITGIGSYSGTIEKEFEIIPKNVTPAITLSADSFTYSGQSQKPILVSVKDGDKALTDADFDITWPEGCINSGTYEVAVTLKGNYSGSGKAVFTIKKAAQTVTAKPWIDELGVNLSTSCTVDGIGSITYTSSNPSVVTVDGYGWLTGCAEGTAIITVTANGDENHLSGQTTFEITVKSIYAVTSGPCGENATWTYYNNGTVEINGTGIIEPRKNSSGDYLWDSFYTDDPVWDYKKVDTVIINEGITGIGGEFFSERSSYGYGAMSDSPTTVIIADSVNTIYKWAFINCSKLERVYIGSGLMTLENCAFTYCLSLKDISVSENNNWFTTYDGALYSKDLKSLYKLPNNGRTEFSISQETVTIKEDALGDLEHLSKLTIPKSVKVIEDYALDGSNNLKDIYYEGSPAEWRKLTIGTHNTVLETANIHYAESDKSVEDCTLTLSTTSYVYDGNAKKPEVIIVDDTKTLEEGVDYQITFANNTDAGTATITITGIGSYIGTVERTFEITPQTITPTITLSQSSFTYNGKEQKPSVTVSYNGKQLKEGVDYNLAYDNNIEPGTASVTISCIGNYSGSATKKFTINKNNVLTGTWQKNSKGWWYSWSDGSYPKSKFENINDKTYYFNSSGYMVTGWQSIGGKWYYFNASGAMMTGWQSIGGKWYYMNSTGAMQTGLQNINGKTYYFSAGGAMATGWQKINNKWYYFSAGGAMVTGWQKISNKWYYFDANGVMLTGWQSIGGKWYYFEGGGVMAANKWVGNYYLTASGAMATNTWIGKYYVGADGKWIPNYKAAN